MTAADTRMTTRELPWFGTSTSLVDGLQTADAALEAAGLDWEVDTKPLYFTVRVNGKEKRIKASKNAVYRKDTFDELGIVGSRYRTWQNTQSFSFLDKVAAHGGPKFQAAGSLAGGARVFVVMKMETVTIVGDEHDIYVLFLTSHDGTSTVTATTSVVRLQCTNMFRATLASDTPVFKARHIDADLQDEAGMEAAAENALGIANRDIEKFGAVAEQLASVMVDHDHALPLLQTALPWRTKATDKEIEKIVVNWEESETIENDWRGTGWGLLNAVTEHLGHGRSQRSSEAGLKRALGVNSQIEARLVRALVGA